MQRGVHVARVKRKEPYAVGFRLLIPNRRQMGQSGLARAIRAPAGIGADRRIAGDVDHQRATTFACGRGKRTEQGFRQPERADEVDRERLFQLFALGIGK